MTQIRLSLKFETIILTLILFTSLIKPTSEEEYTQEDTSIKILDGEYAKLEDHKHHVSIRTFEMTDETQRYGGHFCSGSLIGPEQVLTAAHCMFFKDSVNNIRKFFINEIYVVMGQLSLLTETNFTVVRTVISISLHQYYKRAGTKQADIAILLLNQSIPTSNPYVKSIQWLKNEPVSIGTQCHISGWGKTENETFSLDLKTAKVSTKSVFICNSTESYKGKLRYGMICAGNYSHGGVDTCTGDSGSPLVCDDYLTGIASWGYGCGNPRLPGIYTDTHYYRKWIFAQITQSFIINIMDNYPDRIK